MRRSSALRNLVLSDWRDDIRWSKLSQDSFIHGRQWRSNPLVAATSEEALETGPGPTRESHQDAVVEVCAGEHNLANHKSDRSLRRDASDSQAKVLPFSLRLGRVSYWEVGQVLGLMLNAYYFGK